MGEEVTAKVLERLDDLLPELWAAFASLSDSVIAAAVDSAAADIRRVASGRAMLSANIFAVLHTKDLLAAKLPVANEQAVIDQLTRMLTWMTRTGVGSSVPQTPEDQSGEWSAQYKALDWFVEKNAQIRLTMERSWRGRIFGFFKGREWFDRVFVQSCTKHILASENIVLPDESVARFAAGAVTAVYQFGRLLCAA